MPDDNPQPQPQPSPTLLDWAKRIGMTFIAAALFTIPVFNQTNIDKPSLAAVATSAGVAGVNAVIRLLQKVIPFVPDPQ